MATGTPSKVRITKRSVDACEVKEKPYFIWDDVITGFGVKINPTGRKVYVFQYRVAAPGKSAQTPARRFTIGKHGNLTADQARQKAGELALLVHTQNIDPADQKREQFAERERIENAKTNKARLETELAFSAFADRWLEHYAKYGGRSEERAVRQSSIRQAKLVVNTFLKPHLKDRPIPSLGPDDIKACYSSIPQEKKGMRRAVFAYASILFGWAVEEKAIPANFLRDMRKPPAPKTRDRYLEKDEIAAFWQATYAINEPFGAFFRLLLITMQRRSEVAELDWSELNRADSQWVIPEGRSKNDKAHIVHLNELAIVELDRLAGGEEWPKRGFVFSTTGHNPISGISKAKAVLDLKMDEQFDEPIKHWRIHDLRRTGATGLNGLGVRFEVTEAVLNHVGQSKSGVAGVYQRYEWLPEKRDALDAWSANLKCIFSGKDQSNVVELRPSTHSA